MPSQNQRCYEAQCATKAQPAGSEPSLSGQASLTFDASQQRVVCRHRLSLPFGQPAAFRVLPWTDTGLPTNFDSCLGLQAGTEDDKAAIVSDLQQPTLQGLSEELIVTGTASLDLTFPARIQTSMASSAVNMCSQRQALGARPSFSPLPGAL